MAIKFGRPIEMRDVARRDAAAASPALDLTVRPRRNRKSEWARRMVPENVLTTDDLIWPLFVTAGHNHRAAVASMPGIEATGVRWLWPPVTNNGQIRSSVVSTFSRTIRRAHSDLRLRRGRTVRSRAGELVAASRRATSRISIGRPNLIAICLILRAH